MEQLTQNRVKKAVAASILGVVGLVTIGHKDPYNLKLQQPVGQERIDKTPESSGKKAIRQPDTTLRPGDSGTKIRTLQRQLVAIGCGTMTQRHIDGVFGPNGQTQIAVGQFQLYARQRGEDIKPTGLADKKTQTLIKEAAQIGMKRCGTNIPKTIKVPAACFNVFNSDNKQVNPRMTACKNLTTTPECSSGLPMANTPKNTRRFIRCPEVISDPTLADPAPSVPFIAPSQPVTTPSVPARSSI